MSAHFSPAALACLLSAVGLFRVATGDGPPAASLPCWALGVPGQDTEGSCDPADVGVSVDENEEDEEDEDQGEEERPPSAASLRGCSCRLESWGGGRGGDHMTNPHAAQAFPLKKTSRLVGKHKRLSRLSQDPVSR